MSLPPHLVDHRIIYAALKSLSILPLVPLDHFVHMVLFFHCADDDDDDQPVLRRRNREEETLDVV